MTRTKPRWITDPAALLTLLHLKGLQPGDIGAFRSTILRGRERDGRVRTRMRIQFLTFNERDCEFITRMYRTTSLWRSDGAEWQMIGWRRP